MVLTTAVTGTNFPGETMMYDKMWFAARFFGRGLHVKNRNEEY